MRIFCPEEAIQAAHAPATELSRAGAVDYPESPARYAAIRARLAAAPWAQLLDSTAAPMEALLSVHRPGFLAFLGQAHGAWRAHGHEGDLVATTFGDCGGEPPAGPAAAAGHYGFDTTPIAAATWDAACAAAGAALAAADAVRCGAPAAYALCRPPGHHAGPARFGGYCYLNHAALAARRLADGGRVAVIDVDYHHGNGTQEVFYADGGVLFVSLHADPDWEYPLYWGRAGETGTGDGLGRTLNVPLPPGTDDGAYLEALAGALDAVDAYEPAHLVVSAGFDTWRGDPLGAFTLSEDGIGRIGERLAALGRPTAIVQEGGYDVEALGSLAATFLAPFHDSGHDSDLMDESTGAGR